ncbi:MAG: hypothetical protein SCM57_08905, partial [Bacillota bacterium]|nr:hypothetical protein [Bacillota bacterium]
TVQGGMLADTVVFGPGETIISGSLCYGTLSSDGGTYVCYGQQRLWDGPVFPVIDFTLLEEQALAEGWYDVAAEDGLYRLDAAAGLAAGPIYVPGDLILDGGFLFDGLILAGGTVDVQGVPTGKIVLLAGGDVSLAGEVLCDEETVLAVVSAGRVVAPAGGLLRGVLFAKELELAGLEIDYCDDPVLDVLAELPEEIPVYCASFAVEWIEAVPRR